MRVRREQALRALREIEWRLASRNPSAQLPPALLLEPIRQTPIAWQSIHDPHLSLAILGTRRATKSYTWTRKLLHDGAVHPHTHQIYVNSTRKEAWRIAWRGAKGMDGIKPLTERYGIPGRAYDGALKFEFGNGSLIELFGADDEAAIDKALGGAYFRAWFDESQKLRWLEHALKETLGPAMMDVGGQIVCTGSPDRAASGYFHELTQDLRRGTGPDDVPEGPTDRNGFRLYVYSALDNPHFGETPRERHTRTVVAYCKRFGLKESDPEVRRAWGPEWVTEDSLHVYHANRVSTSELFWADQKMTEVELPRLERLDGEGVLVNEPIVFPDIQAMLEKLPLDEDGDPREWRIGMSSDFGIEPDPFGISLVAWSPGWDTLLELATWRRNKLLPEQQLYLARLVWNQVRPLYYVGDADGGGRPIVKGWSAGWVDREPLPIKPAEKQNKAIFIEFLNGALRSGHVKLLTNSPLYEEMKRLTWRVTKQGKMVENVARDMETSAKKYANDCTDMFLYNFREARHHRMHLKPKPPKYGTPAYFAAEEIRMREAFDDDMEMDDELEWVI